MKLAAKKKGRKATFFKLYTKELEGIFFISFITMGVALLLKGIFFTLSLLSLKSRYTYESNIVFKSLKDLVSQYHLSTDRFYEIIVSGFIICIVGIIVLTAFMSFYIFLKEWFGRKKTIYTLMTLPVKKINIILSKLSAVLTYFFTLLGISIFSIIIEYNVSNMLIGFKMNFKELIFNFGESLFLISDFKILLTFVLLIMAGIAFSFLLVMCNRTHVIWGTIVGVLLVAMLLGIVFFVLIEGVVLFTYEIVPVICIAAITLLILSISGSTLLFEKKVHV